MTNNVRMCGYHFVTKDLTDIKNLDVFKKGEIVVIESYNVNNCTFKISSTNVKKSIVIDEDDLKHLYFIEDTK